METEGKGSFQLSDLNNDVRCIYHILTSRVHLVLRHTMITIERAHYLYALLIEAFIDFGALVTTIMMLVRLNDWGIALPYGALITQIAEHQRYERGLSREWAIGAHFLNASNTHLREAEQEWRPRRPSRATKAGKAPIE